MSATWAGFSASAPEMSAAGARLLGTAASGAAYLATVPRDGGPRVHPVMPVLADGGLYVFVVNLSYKYRDLIRDGRYALHSAPGAEGGEEFYLAGPAVSIPAAGVRAGVVAASGGRLGHSEFEVLFELRIVTALHTSWANWGTSQAWPSYQKWAAPA